MKFHFGFWFAYNWFDFVTSLPFVKISNLSPIFCFDIGIDGFDLLLLTLGFSTISVHKFLDYKLIQM
jgi:hypothetical protein